MDARWVDGREDLTAVIEAGHYKVSLSFRSSEFDKEEKTSTPPFQRKVHFGIYFSQ